MTSDRIVVRLAICAVMLGTSVFGSAAGAACYGPNQQLPPESVQSFLADPAGLLGQFPTGGAQLISQVRDLVASDAAALPAVAGLLASANGDQQRAIGSGLGQAVRVCLGSDQALANRIQQAVATSGSNLARDAYAVVVPDVPIGSAAGAGGGGGGGGGGGLGGPTVGIAPGTSGTLAAPFASFSQPTSGSGLLSGSGAGGGASALPRSTPTTTTATTASTTTASTSVSER